MVGCSPDTFAVQDGVLCIWADVSVEKRALLPQSTGETSPWKQAEGRHTDKQHIY